MKPKRLLALGVLLIGVTAADPLAGAQKPDPPQPTEQQKLKDRVDALESQLKEANAKADRAAIEKDYIERIQKEVNAYYEKAFNTQGWIVSVIGLTITIVLFISARFGFSIFDRRIEQAIARATTDLETKFDKKLANELQTLKESNAAQVKQLEDALAKRIDQTDADLRLRSGYQFQFTQALAFLGDEQYRAARHHFRIALTIYNSGKARQVVKKESAVVTLANVFRSLNRQDSDHYVERAKGELADGFYNDFEDELDAVALQLDWLAPLVRDRKQTPPPAQSPAPTGAPATEQELPAPPPDKSQPAKPDEHKKK